MADGDEPTFTPPTSQEEFDRMVGARLQREREKFADYDTLKEKAGKFDEADAASKTELQKLQDQLADKDKELANLPATVRKQALAFASQAAAAGFADPEDALVFLGSDVDLSDKDAVKTALDELAERKPHLLAPEEPKKRLQTKPKPKGGKTPDGEEEGKKPEGKAAVAAALRGFAQQKK
jgi:hypothetical protein